SKSAGSVEPASIARSARRAVATPRRSARTVPGTAVSRCGRWSTTPRTETVPPVGTRAPETSRSSVDLPAPLAPTSPVLPRPKAPLTPSRAGVPSGQEKERSWRTTEDEGWGTLSTFRGGGTSRRARGGVSALAGRSAGLSSLVLSSVPLARGTPRGPAQPAPPGPLGATELLIPLASTYRGSIDSHRRSIQGGLHGQVRRPRAPARHRRRTARVRRRPGGPAAAAVGRSRRPGHRPPGGLRRQPPPRGRVPP